MISGKHGCKGTPRAVTLWSMAIAVFAVLVPVAEGRSLAEGNEREQDADLVISGTVMVRGTREAKPGVRVLLSPSTAPIFGVRQDEAEASVTTDSGGRFRFAGLSPGTYRVSLAPADENRVFAQEGIPVDVGEGGLPPRVDLWMTPRSEISGQVFDERREPVVGGRIVPLRQGYMNGRHVLIYNPAIAVETLTDETGSYTLSVPPGEYYIQMRPESDQASPTLYYPGALHPEEAVPVTVRQEANLQALNWYLQDDEQFRVSFRLSLTQYTDGTEERRTSSPEENPVPLDVWLRPIRPGLIDIPAVEIDLENRDGEGYSLVPRVAAGEYELLIKSASILRNAMPGVDWNRVDPIAILRVTVADGDLDLGAIQPSPRARVTGRVLMRSVQGRSMDVRSLPRLWFRDTAFSIAAGSIELRPSEEGIFVLDGVHPGLLRFSVNADDMPDGWYVASVSDGVRDVLRNGLLVAGSREESIEIVISDDGGRIEGIARDAAGSIVSNALMVLIPPIDRRGPFARFPFAVSDASGIFSFQAVAPGEYRLLALDMAGNLIETPYWEAPEFLAEYERRGERVVVAPSSQLAINPVTILVPE